MIEIKNKEKCHGCHGCYNICPKNCISMEIDEEGFWYPKVDMSVCINCNLCEKVCPIINDTKTKSKMDTYACINKDNNIREKSSSGGVFWELCRIVIEQKGIVFGAMFDKEFNVKHSYADTLEGCEVFRGAKYIQSKIGNSYKEVKEFLNEGKMVLFSGTPCQIEGLNKYLMKKYNNLLLVDIACHGVPSPIVYKKYMNKISTLSKEKIRKIEFRNKSTGWKRYSFKVNFENGEFKQIGYNNMYMRGYLNDLYLRPSCYECTNKKPATSADITLADYWGVENVHEKMNDDKGVSLIIVHNEKGERILNKISDKLLVIKTDCELALKANPSIKYVAKINPNREAFFNEINNKDIEYLISKYTNVRFKERVKGKLKRRLIKLKLSIGK